MKIQVSQFISLVLSFISEEHHLAVWAISFEMFVTEIVSQFEMATPVSKAICMVNC